MNSEKFQKNFQEIYKTFFSNNNLVVSWNFNFPWWYEWISNNLSTINLKIKSQSPLKCYIWFKLIENFDIVFNNVFAYNVVNKNFEKREYIELIKERDKIIDLLKNEIKKLWFSSWIEINILTETSCWHSFWFSWTSGSLISYWIYVLYNHFVSLSKKSEEKLLKNYYNEIISIAWRMDYISRYWNSNIHNIFFTLNWVKGISYFLFKDYVSYNSLKDIKKIKYKMWKILNSNNLSLPFDYYLIFSWIPTDTKQVEHYKRIEFHDNSITSFIKSTLNKSYKYDKKSKFDLINIEKIKIFELLYKINKKPYDENLIDSFIKQVNKYRYIIWVYETQNNFANDFRHYFRQNKTKMNEEVWICPNYTWKLWWWYIVVTKHWLSRDTIEKTLLTLKKLYSDIEIEFSSFDYTHIWSWGVKINQFISSWLFSQYIGKNKVLYIDNKNNSYLWDYNEIINSENDALILDTIWNKMYFNWIRLTSNDIPSQTTTIELLLKLLDKNTKEIINTDLPVSSYSKNKNEMLWKIILPLIKYFGKKTKEKIYISCIWKLSNFSIKMWKINSKIWIIKSL